jgi:hypothetical protein
MLDPTTPPRLMTVARAAAELDCHPDLDASFSPAKSAADEPSAAPGARGGQAKAEHQQAASRAQDLPLAAARQNDRPGPPHGSPAALLPDEPICIGQRASDENFPVHPVGFQPCAEVHRGLSGGWRRNAKCDSLRDGAYSAYSGALLPDRPTGLVHPGLRGFCVGLDLRAQTATDIGFGRMMMVNRIEHSWEPKRLFLAWQPPEVVGDRFRWAVALLDRRVDPNAIHLRYFNPGLEFESFNQGRQFEQLVSLGNEGYPAFSRTQAIHDHAVTSSCLYLRSYPSDGDARRGITPRVG